MKTLILMRHAKSSWDSPDVDDHDRPLNARGMRDAPRMGARLLEEGLVPARLASSTALRAVETARLVAQAMAWAGDFERHAGLYHAEARKLIDFARDCPDDTDRLMIVAHNPGMEDLVGGLVGTLAPMPTAAVAVFRQDVSAWADFARKAAPELLALWRPKALETP
jgi:phosphohistidine phosphatase